jgi:hypothetical protein
VVLLFFAPYNILFTVAFKNNSNFAKPLKQQKQLRPQKKAEPKIPLEQDIEMEVSFLCDGILREYMARKKYTKTLEAFDEENV